MLLRRKMYDKLLKWKESSKGAKAALVEGARRVGKSTVVEEFARHEYRSHIVIDFAKTPQSIKDNFNEHMDDLDTFFMLLSVEYHTRLYKRNSVIVFDEVQMFPKAREAIKYLVADGRYDYIETGSLISIRENVGSIVIPSEERSMKMYPLDFEEFCWAFGEELLLDYISACFEKRQPLEQAQHKRAMLLFKQYLLVGGMPKPLVAFIEGDYDFRLADEEKRDILNLYREDIMKINSPYRSKVISIFDQIPGLLSRHEKRVVLKEVAKGSYFDQYADTFFWLSDSMIANECFLCADPNIGLSMNEDRTYIKCYLGDTGLLTSHAFDENEMVENDLYRQILSGKLSINQGMLYENAIAQMLVAAGHKLYFYTHYSPEKHRNDVEIDFLVSNGSRLNFKVSPIEVKSGRRYAATSLMRFKERFGSRIAQCYIIHPKNLVEAEGILRIPPYMTYCLGA